MYILCIKVWNKEWNSSIQIRKYNSKTLLHLYFIVSHLGANSLGQWK